MTSKPGPRNLITDVAGLTVGQAEDASARTGVTVILPTERAVAAVNSFGSVVVPGGQAFWAAPFEIDEEFGGIPIGGARAGPDDWGLAKGDTAPRTNTTLAVVAVDAALTPADARRLAVMAQDGLARAIRPVHTPFDGDVLFAIATGQRPLTSAKPATLARLGTLAADCVARAVARGVFEARPWPGTETLCWRDLAD